MLAGETLSISSALRQELSQIVKIDQPTGTILSKCGANNYAMLSRSLYVLNTSLLSVRFIGQKRHGKERATQDLENVDLQMLLPSLIFLLLPELS